MDSVLYASCFVLWMHYCDMFVGWHCLCSGCSMGASWASFGVGVSGVCTVVAGNCVYCVG